MLRMVLTGTPEIGLDGRSLASALNGKLLALVVYLAVTGLPQTRETLANLLWSELGDDLARKNLRGALYELRRMLGTSLVTARHETYLDRRVPCWVDVGVLQTYLTNELLHANPQGFREVLLLYRGEFLAGFHVRNAPVFEEWLAARRTYLHNLVVQGWQRLAEHALQHQEDGLGLDATNHLLALDSAHEAAHRQRMLFLARSGQPRSALAQFEICRRILADELAITPSPETVALYEQIRAGQFLPERGEQRQGEEESVGALPRVYSVEGAGLSTVPRSQRLVGRTAELALLSSWADSRGIQLAGVFGLPGQGKTQLVAHWIHTQAGRPQEFSVATGPNPVGYECCCWISLQTMTSLAAVVRVWLQVLGEDRAVPVDTVEQMLPFLLQQFERRRSLFVLDNVEEVWQPGSCTSQLQPAYQGFSALLQAVVGTVHRSTVVLIGRAVPPEFSRLEEDYLTARSLLLEGLTVAETHTFLNECGVRGSAATFSALHTAYQGNPLALAAVAESVFSLFGSDSDRFVQGGTPIFQQLRHLLVQQFEGFSSLEQQIVRALAEEVQPLSTSILGERLGQEYAAYLEALGSLVRQGWVIGQQGTLALPTLIVRFVRQCAGRLGEPSVNDPQLVWL